MPGGGRQQGGGGKSRREETLTVTKMIVGDCLDCDYGSTGAYVCQNIKLHTLHMCSLLYDHHTSKNWFKKIGSTLGRLFRWLKGEEL